MQCLCSRFAITACHMTELLHDNVFYKKETRKKEGNEYSVFRVERFQIPAIVPHQQYLRMAYKCLYKQNEPVCETYTHVSCNRSNEVVVLKLTQPYLSNTYHI